MTPPRGKRIPLPLLEPVGVHRYLPLLMHDGCRQARALRHLKASLLSGPDALTLATVLASFAPLEEARLSMWEATVQCVAELAWLLPPSLSTLDLSWEAPGGGPGGEVQLDGLARMPNLWHLRLCVTAAGEYGVRLPRLPALTKLDLDGSFSIGDFDEDQTGDEIGLVGQPRLASLTACIPGASLPVHRMPSLLEVVDKENGVVARREPATAEWTLCLDVPAGGTELLYLVGEPMAHATTSLELRGFWDEDLLNEATLLPGLADLRLVRAEPGSRAATEQDDVHMSAMMNLMHHRPDLRFTIGFDAV